MCFLAYGLSLGALWLDQNTSLPSNSAILNAVLYSGDTAGARTLLSSIATSMIAVSGVTFSVTVVALSMAASQYGPRLLLNFMKDTGNQIVLGTFISSFIYCLLVLWYGNVSQGHVLYPASASIAVLLAVLSVWVLIYFFHHVSQSIRAENIVVLVAKDVMCAIDRYLDNKALTNHTHLVISTDQQPEFGYPIMSPSDGYIQTVDHKTLTEFACKHKVCIKLKVSAGNFVTQGQPIIEANQALDESHGQNLLRHLIIGEFRTGEDDPVYGIHQLVEVAVRALSPGINDPNTAISCIDWLRVIVKKFIECKLPSPLVFDENNELRLITDALHFEKVVATAFNQIRQNAYSTPSVIIRLLEVLVELVSYCDTKAQATPLLEQAKMLQSGVSKDNIVTHDKTDIDRSYQAVLNTFIALPNQTDTQADKI